MQNTLCFHSVSAKSLNQNVNLSEESVFGTFGRHVIVDFSGCDFEKLADLNFIKETMEQGVIKSKATIISSKFHKFSPTGVSGIILLAESHASIHTWPHEGYASMDIYTCGEHIMPETAFQYIALELKAKVSHITFIDRGLKNDYFYNHIVREQRLDV